MVVFLLALIGTLLVMAVLVIGHLGFGRREKIVPRAFFTWFIGFFIFNYILSLLIVYFSAPALTGPFWGWQWVLWPLLLSSLISLFASPGRAFEITSSGSQFSISRRAGGSGIRRSLAAGLFGLLIVGLIGILIPFLIVIFTTWFDGNAKALANIPVVKRQDTPNLPPTDPKHLVLVSQSIAAYKGQQILGSTGQNLGSAYKIASDSYALQSINKHLYYVAPLTYNNIFVNISNPTTPGFVMVDAEDPQKPPMLKTGDTDAIRYLPGGLLNQDLQRHVYLNGYTYGRLVDPTLELDDQQHPFWTISLMQPSRGYTGDVLSEVLVIDANSGAIQKYQPGNVPAWIDRVMPADTVHEYLQWWGLYHDAPWFNPSGFGQQKPAGEPVLLYNNIDEPVWLVPMTSSASSDNSSTGIFLFNTHKNEALFYPKASGLGIGDNVFKTFQSTRANIRGYDVASVQLYQIYNTPTWAAIYVQHTSSGDIFQAVGLVSARELNGNNVQFATDLPTALRDYQQWLTQQNSDDNNNPGTPQAVTGKVLRVSSVQQGSNTIFYLQIEGQKVIFTANLSLSPKLPLVQPGDTVVVTYTDAGTQVVNLRSFDDTSIKLGDTSPTPTATPKP